MEYFFDKLILRTTIGILALTALEYSGFITLTLSSLTSAGHPKKWYAFYKQGKNKHKMSSAKPKCFWSNQKGITTKGNCKYFCACIFCLAAKPFLRVLLTVKQQQRIATLTTNFKVQQAQHVKRNFCSKMLTRKKLRKILDKHSKQLETEFFRKHRVPHETPENESKKIVLEDADADNDEELQTNDKIENAPEMLVMSNLNFNANKTSITKDEQDLSNHGIVRDYKNLDIFHNAIRPIMLVAQLCAIMPLVGVHHANPRRMRFTYKCIPIILTLTFLLASGVLTASYIKLLMKIGANAKNFVGVVFFGTVQIACLLFLSLAKRWPRLIQYWTRTELIFTRFPYEELKRNLRKRVRLAALFIFMCSLFEHVLYLLSAILKYTRTTHLCASANNSSGQASFEHFIQRNYDYVFQILNYNIFVGVYILLVNGACTFVWNYMDLFIMMISKGIAYRFEQISFRIKKIADKNIPETAFVEIREHYVKICELLDYVDENLSGIILLSCVNNLYFVCYQLLNIFNKLRWPIDYIYFWYSLSFLVGRTAFVFLTAASINDESKAALGALRCVSNKSWCIEVERLIFQMSTQTVALSGKKFYYLTRRLLFGMAGTIVTYELVLLQFDEPNRNKGLPPLCG